jgi:hypothetical protein
VQITQNKGEAQYKVILVEGKDVLSDAEPWRRLREIFHSTYYIDSEPVKELGCNIMTAESDREECQYLNDFVFLKGNSTDSYDEAEMIEINRQQTTVKLAKSVQADEPIDEFLHVLKKVCQLESISVQCEASDLQRHLRNALETID